MTVCAQKYKIVEVFNLYTATNVTSLLVLVVYYIEIYM